MRLSSFAPAGLRFLPGLLLGLATLTLGVSSTTIAPRIGSEAEATTAVLMTLDEMVRVSEHVVVAEPVERVSQWETIGESERIVTYTRLSVESPIVGGANQDIWVRTLGGIVGKIGQHVAGEAQFTLHQKALVFLARPGDKFVVTGMAQGHFPIDDSGSARTLKSSPDTGTLLRSKKTSGPSAREELVGETLARASDKIQAAKAAQK
jgi:hypothetical protein